MDLKKEMEVWSNNIRNTKIFKQTNCTASMKFCYLHPTIEAQGKCSGCGNDICQKDYRIIDEITGQYKEWVDTKSYNPSSNMYDRGRRLETTNEISPVVYCVLCFDRIQGIDPESDPSVDLTNPNKTGS